MSDVLEYHLLIHNLLSFLGLEQCKSEMQTLHVKPAFFFYSSKSEEVFHFRHRGVCTHRNLQGSCKSREVCYMYSGYSDCPLKNRCLAGIQGPWALNKSPQQPLPTRFLSTYISQRCNICDHSLSLTLLGISIMITVYACDLLECKASLAEVEHLCSFIRLIIHF